MQVKDIMTRGVEAVHPTATLEEAAQKMQALELGALPVRDGERLEGMVTDRDITVRATALGLDPITNKVQDVMTPGVVALPGTSPVTEAATAMRDSDVGSVVVLDQQGKVCGIVTDRDIVIRGVAETQDISSLTLDDICSDNPTTLTPDATISEAVRIMREQAIRRIPIVEEGRPVGMVSLGDLAVETDVEVEPALEDIANAPPDE